MLQPKLDTHLGQKKQVTSINLWLYLRRLLRQEVLSV